jgi:hypothetical protein
MVRLLQDLGMENNSTLHPRMEEDCSELQLSNESPTAW